MPIALLYHDVTAANQDDSSGFPGPGAARYKITARTFRAHMAAVSEAIEKDKGTRRQGDKETDSPVSLSPGPLVCLSSSPTCLLTFDDGGVSASTEIADIVESYGWRGHFFITANYIDTPAFVSRRQIRDLASRGHVIGTHSCSHPPRMSCCSPEHLVKEWRRSREILSDILGQNVIVGSIPGGYYSPAVAKAAAFAGIHALFTSEPTTRSWTIDGCQVLGRYTIYRGMLASEAGAIAAGRLIPRLRQSALWNLKKLAKLAGGQVYLEMRSRLLAHRYATAEGRAA